MTLVYVAAAIILIIYLLARNGAGGRTVSEVVASYDEEFPSVWRGPDTLNPTHVLIFDHEWWPRTRKVGEEDFHVKTKDVQKVIEEPVVLSWWSGSNFGYRPDLYDLDFASGKVVDGGDEGEDNRFDKFNPARKYKDKRIEWVKWSTAAKPYQVDGDVWNVTLEIHERTGPYPWDREKGHRFYLHPRSRNVILEKLTDNDEIAAAFEAKMAEVYAKHSKK